MTQINSVFQIKVTIEIGPDGFFWAWRNNRSRKIIQFRVHRNTKRTWQFPL